MASLFTARRKPKRVASADSRDDTADGDDGGKFFLEPFPQYHVARFDLTFFTPSQLRSLADFDPQTQVP